MAAVGEAVGVIGAGAEEGEEVRVVPAPLIDVTNNPIVK